MSSNKPLRDWNDAWSQRPPAASLTFRDPDSLADAVLTVCGAGSILDVGCGDGRLVQALLRRGADARGVDLSAAAVELANRRAPGRFQPADATALPGADGSVGSALFVGVLDHLREEQVEAALREAARIARTAVILVVRSATPPDDPELLARGRRWWLERAFQTGLRRHARAASADQYRDELLSPDEHVLAFECADSTGPDAADFLRSTDVGAFETASRYRLASRFLRQGDHAATVGPGASALAGARVIAANAPVDRVIALCTNSADAIESSARGVVSVRFDPSPGLDSVSDESLDALLILSNDAEKQAGNCYGTARRVLRPAGRLIVFQPDESSLPASPADFLLEHTLVCEHRPDGDTALVEPDWRRIEDTATPRSAALRVLMKSPIGASRDGYVENNFPTFAEPGANITAFARDYDNPWLVRAMVSIGLRSTNPAVLDKLAVEVRRGGRAGSADLGAALCVRAYRMLESGACSHADIRAMIEQIDAFDRHCDSTPHAQRWRISNLYVAGRLHMESGALAAARTSFLRCAELDPLVFSPLLATKTIDALFRAGLLHWNDGDAEAARQCWRRGLAESRRVLQADWSDVCGSLDEPVTFGLPEVAQVAHGAARCADALWASQRAAHAPGLMWSLLESRAAARGPGGDAQHWRRLAERRETSIREQSVYNADLRAGRDWWENQARHARHGIELRDRMLAELHAWTAELQTRLDKAYRRAEPHSAPGVCDPD